ncbi:sugar kinase [Nocardiopsis sp. CNT312]|uniref:sugar kinase n=1 Tax=Nocardiopsis sp. CNT312 TaxID=1137268 RepID=UPI0004BB92C3|nr:sugar kinase [Nocardiopsis sp. CNT312]
MDAQQLDAVCVGETMALLVPDGDSRDGVPLLRAEIGGAESNVAVHLARAGYRAAWLGAVGDDVFGRLVRDRLTASGVRCLVRVDPERPTGLYTKEPGPGGGRAHYWRRESAASALGPETAAEVRRLRPRLVHTTGITAALSDTCLALVEDLLSVPSDGTLRSFDVNYRPALHGDHNADTLLSLARRCDIVFCGTDEAASLWGTSDPGELAGLLHGPGLLVLKQGAKGAMAVRHDRSWFQPAPRVSVVDPVGAGDAFAAGFLGRLLEGAAVPDCLAEGARTAGRVLGIPGDAPTPGPGHAAARETGQRPGRDPRGRD